MKNRQAKPNLYKTVYLANRETVESTIRILETIPVAVYRRMTVKGGGHSENGVTTKISKESGNGSSLSMHGFAQLTILERGISANSESEEWKREIAIAIELQEYL